MNRIVLIVIIMMLIHKAFIWVNTEYYIERTILPYGLSHSILDNVNLFKNI